MGREQQAKQADFEQHMASLRQAAATARHLERFRRPLMVGGTYTYTPRFPMVLEVLDIVPMLQPDALPGTARVILSCQLTLIAYDGVPLSELQLVGLPQAKIEPPDPTKGITLQEQEARDQAIDGEQTTEQAPSGGEGSAEPPPVDTKSAPAAAAEEPTDGTRPL